VISFLSESTTSCTTDEGPRRHSCIHEIHTLMMIVRMDRNKSGLLAGSRTVEEDWNDWNSPVISRERAKLFRNSTYSKMSAKVDAKTRQLARLEMAVLKSTRSVSSWADRSILCTPGSEPLCEYLLVNKKGKGTPSKSIATINASSVGVTDIQTPSVVRMADPANEVSTK
jgi:hypothetical protein